MIEPRDEQKGELYKKKCYAAIERDIESRTVSPMVALKYARLHERGERGIDESLDRAKELYDLSIAKLKRQGDVDSLLLLSGIYMHGRAMRFEDKAQGERYMEMALATGHPNAWYANSQLLEDTNKAESINYLRKAAEAGHYRAIDSLAYSLPDNADEKIRWNMAAYDQKGDHWNASAIARLYEKRGNQEESIRWRLLTLYDGNGHSLSASVKILYGKLREFSGVNDLEYSEVEARKVAWDSMLASVAYAELYKRAQQLIGLCDDTVGFSDNAGYCEVEPWTKGWDRPI